MNGQGEQKSVGAIWKKQTRGGIEMLSISLEINGEKKSFVAFLNAQKQGKQPDFKIFESRQLVAQYRNDKPDDLP